MLPNWLYGKSKSKLQEILGGGGGGTTYAAGDGIDISNGIISFDPATTPAIDPSKIDGLDDDLAALAPKTALSNPNILDNPWFTVNQRGATTVSESGVYFVDRWKTSINTVVSQSYTLSNGILTMDNTSGSKSIHLLQKCETSVKEALRGKTVTASVLLSDGTILSGTKEFLSSGVYIDTNDLLVYSSDGNSEILTIEVKKGKTVSIKAIKLELGSVSTLAMDTAPNYATELLKCQRYFVRIDNTSGGIALGTAVALNNDRANICIKLPVSMCTKPTPSNYTSMQVINGVQTISVESIASSSHDNGYETLNVVATGTTQGTAYLVRLASSGYVDFSADL